MKKRLQKLRQKSDLEKKTIVRTMALITTGMIVLIYIFILTFGPDKVEIESENTPQQALTVFGEILNSGFEEISSSASELDFVSENLEESFDQIQQEITTVSETSTDTEININTTIQ